MPFKCRIFVCAECARWPPLPCRHSAVASCSAARRGVRPAAASPCSAELAAAPPSPLKRQLGAESSRPGSSSRRERASPRTPKLPQQSRSNLRFRVAQQTKRVFARLSSLEEEPCVGIRTPSEEFHSRSAWVPSLWLGIPSHCVCKIAL